MTFEKYLSINWECVATGIYSLEDVLWEYTRRIAGNIKFDE